MTVMLIGFFVVVGLVVAVAVNASAAYLGQRRLADLADGAALAASEAAERSSLYAPGDVVALNADAARSSVEEYLTASGAMQRHGGLTWDVEQVGDDVRVRLHGHARMPLVPPGWDARADVRADAVVQLRIR